MRLADHIIAECGKSNDVGGIFTNTAAAIRKAERFELTDDVARAGYNLTKSKPSSLLSALPLCRLPFPKIWLEWRGGLTTGMVRPEFKRDPSFAPDPLKQGVLIEADDSGQLGTMTFAWIHKAKPERMGDTFYSPVNISPLGSLFNWRDDANVREDAAATFRERYPTSKHLRTGPGIIEWALLQRYKREMDDGEAKAWMERSVFKDWGRFANAPAERKALLELGRHEIPWIVPHTHGFFEWCTERVIAHDSEDMLKTFMRDIIQASWEPDIEGEPPFAETVIAMMNSRNAIEHRPVDLSGLNKARTKRGRQTFLPYQTTHLKLSQAQARAHREGVLSREDAGLHRVRGHFKIRKTGLYWWHPFFRGDPAKQVKRAEYKVEV